MLNAEENERMTRVGPGTPMGELMRRYWHPVATSEELENAWTKPVTILGEKLVLYKDRSGTKGPGDGPGGHPAAVANAADELAVVDRLAPEGGLGQAAAAAIVLDLGDDGIGGIHAPE